MAESVGMATNADRHSGMDNLDGHGSPWNTFFEIRCTCGGTKHFVLGHYVMNPPYGEVFVSPLALECKACGKIKELLDTDAHGYDGKICGKGHCIRGHGERTRFRCPTCGTQPFATISRFEYGAEGVYNDDDLFRRDAQDVFDWFTLRGRCDNCQRELQIADFECA